MLAPNTSVDVAAPLLRIMEVTDSVLLYSSSIPILVFVFLNLWKRILLQHICRTCSPGD